MHESLIITIEQFLDAGIDASSLICQLIAHRKDDSEKHPKSPLTDLAVWPRIGYATPFKIPRRKL